MNDRAWAVVWAQWRAMRNFSPRAGRGSTVVAAVAGVAWYGAWVFAAAMVAFSVRENTKPREFLEGGLMLAFLYWQVVPVLTVSAGASLDMRRLVVYPIPHGELFSLEVLLRLTAAAEVLIVMAGATVGAALHPTLRLWRFAAFVPFIVFNLFLSAGVKDLLSRLLARRKLRELGVLAVLLVAASPQMLLMRGHGAGEVLGRIPGFPWPWSVTADLAAGTWHWSGLASLAAWIGAAYVFGRWQFERGLRFDSQAARATGATPAPAWVEALFRLPGVLFRDPLATMIEKELRTLTRSPRFRIAFLMGFSFGLLIWFPAVFTRGGGNWLQINYLVILFSYSLMLLSEVAIWNVFGFDRGAAQFYWLAPVRHWQVMAAKNVATAVFATLEMAVITAVCLVLGLHVTAEALLESLLASLILMLFLMAIGNLSSLYSPRPVDPNQTWKRGSAGRFQALLLVVYPLLLVPFALAYWARWVLETNTVFYAILGVTALFAATAYAISMAHAVKACRARAEALLGGLAQGEGPVAA